MHDDICDTGDLWLTDVTQARRFYSSAPASETAARAWVHRLDACIEIPNDAGGRPKLIAYRPVIEAELRGDTGLAADERQTMLAHGQRWCDD